MAEFTAKSILTKGILLEQNKEPALSRDLKFFSDEDSRFTYLDTPHRAPEALSPEEIIDLARRAEIVDESSGKPLHEKLRQAREKGLHTVVADAVDDEPYISSQLGPALKLTSHLLGGIDLAKRAVGAENASISLFKDILDSGLKIPKDFDGVPVEKLQGRYPAEYRSKVLTQSPDSVVIGACALIHLHRAAAENRRQTTCFVTVAGDCVANPCNMEVAIGTTLGQVMERCGLIDDPRRVVVGGSMTGYAITDPEGTPVTPMTRGVLAFREEFKQMNFTCIGCGRCAQVCPEGLSPYYIYKYVTSKKFGMLRYFDIDLCTGCGTCSYICPAKLDISRIIAGGKREYVAELRRRRDEQPAQRQEEVSVGPSAR